MNFNLYTIDWTAIGSIATFIAMLIAYWSIIKSNKENEKNRQHQILLLHKEQEQKKLDEMIENILEIAFSIRPLDILNYSSKYLTNSFTTQDRYDIENIQHKDRINGIKLNIQMIKLSNYKNATSFLTHLGNIRRDFSLWAKSINLLYQSLYSSEYLKSNISDEMIKKTIDEMENWCFSIDSRYKNYFNKIQKNENDYIERCYNVLTIFESELSCHISNNIQLFEQEFYKFVEIEQNRIKNIVN